MAGEKQTTRSAGAPESVRGAAKSPIPFVWIFSLISLTGLAGLIGGGVFLLPLLAREVMPGISKHQPSGTSAPEPVNEGLHIGPKQPDPAALLLEREDYAGALNAYAQLQGSASGNLQARAGMERVAALLRSNAFEMTPAKFTALRPSLEEAAAANVVSAQILLGEQLRDRSPAEALKYFQAAAHSGQTEAMTQAGLMLSNGRGTSAPDLRLAVKWFERASAEGDTDAMTALAECLILGKGTPKNPRRAVGLLRSASAFHHPRALNLLGDLYARGIGVTQNYQEAFGYFSRSAAQGFGDGMANVGALTMRGEGVPANPSRAIAIWKEGIRQGVPSCMLNYAKALESGKGMAADAALARHWYVEAARGGNAEAIAWCRDKKIRF